MPKEYNRELFGTTYFTSSNIYDYEFLIERNGNSFGLTHSEIVRIWDYINSLKWLSSSTNLLEVLSDNGDLYAQMILNDSDLYNTFAHECLRWEPEFSNEDDSSVYEVIDAMSNTISLPWYKMGLREIHITLSIEEAGDDVKEDELGLVCERYEAELIKEFGSDVVISVSESDTIGAKPEFVVDNDSDIDSLYIAESISKAWEKACV